MTCERIPLKNGVIFICSRTPAVKKRCKCGAIAVKLCDYPLRGKKAGQTCDRPLCAKCATQLDTVCDMTEERELQKHIDSYRTEEGRGKAVHDLRLAPDTFDLCPPHARLVDRDKEQLELF